MRPIRSLWNKGIKELVLYLFWSPKYNCYKIGHTLYLNRRLAQVRREISDPELRFVIAWPIPDAPAWEHRLHTTFASQLVAIHNHREYFDLNEHDISLINSTLMRAYGSNI